MISVTKHLENTFSVTISLAKCKQVKQLIGLLGGAEKKINNNLKEYSITGHSLSAKVERVQATSPPLSGTFQVTYDNKVLKGE